MNKKYIIAGLVAIAIIGAVAAIFVLKPASDNQEELIPDETMQNIADGMGITVEELEEELNKPLSKEEEANLNEINKMVETLIIQDIAELTEDENPDDNIYNFVDANGNEGTIEMPEATMTEEQIDIWNAQYEEWLAALARGENPGPPPTSYYEDTVILGNPSDPGDNGGELIIYDVAQDEGGINHEMVNPEYTGDTPSDEVDPNSPMSSRYIPPEVTDEYVESIEQHIKNEGIVIGGCGD